MCPGRVGAGQVEGGQFWAEFVGRSAGTLFKRTSYYEAVNRTARAYPSSMGAMEKDERRRTKLGEDLHELLQGVCRGVSGGVTMGRPLSAMCG